VDTHVEEKLTDDVLGSIWLAALIMTYKKSINESNANHEILLRQSEIQRIAQLLCTKTVQSARISQWCNGDHPSSNTNYLRAIGDKRKLTKVGEFNFKKEHPDRLIDRSQCVLTLSESNKSVTFGELYDWYSSVYSKIDFNSNPQKPTDDIELLAPSSDNNELQEDEIKDILKKHIENLGWKTQLAMGKTHGIDVDAYKDKERWIIEVKGCGSRNAMRVNYFLAILGETLQRMSDPSAKYSIALPDIKQYRGLWRRLPQLAKERTGISALFINSEGIVEEIY